jgi:hypothetical protein
VNVTNTSPGSTLTWASYSPTGSNTEFVHPLAGGDFVGNSPTNYFTSNPMSTGSARWTSARTVSLGVRLIPSANITIK